MALLLAITYPEPDRARQAMESVNWLDFDRLVHVKDACWIARDQGGLKVYTRRRAVLGKAAIGGALGYLVGSIFFLPVVGLATGATIGIVKARLNAEADNAIDDAFAASIGAQLDADGSAIIVLFEEGASTPRAARILAQFGGTVHSTNIDPVRLDRFQAMLDQGSQP